jgi:hypothetical protein
MRATLPNALERTGDFSNTRDSNGALIGVYDPATTQVNPKGNGYVRSALPGNKVPTSRMDPVALNVLKYVPLPNVPAADPYTDTNNWLFLGNSPTKESTFNIKIDHRFSDSDSTFLRLTDTKQTRIGSGYGLGVADSYSLARTDHRNRYNAALSETHIFTPNLINEFRANALLFRLDFSNPSYGQGWPQKLGMPSTTPPDSFPTESITGFLTIGPNNTSVGTQNEQTTQFFNAVTWVKRRHTVKFGMEQRFVQVNFIKTNYPSGQYSFSNSRGLWSPFPTRRRPLHETGRSVQRPPLWRPGRHHPGRRNRGSQSTGVHVPLMPDRCARKPSAISPAGRLRPTAI